MCTKSHYITHFPLPSSSQDGPTALLRRAALHPDRHHPLQRPDLPDPSPAEATTDVHGPEYQHGPGLQAQGLREPGPVPQGSQPAQA